MDIPAISEDNFLLDKVLLKYKLI